MWVDRGEGHADVVVLRRHFGDFVIADALGPHPGLGIDREQAEGNVLLAVEFDDLGHFGPFARGLEIGTRRVEELAHHWILGIVARDFGVDMHVDGADLFEIDGH